MILSLAFLAPEIVKAAVEGRLAQVLRFEPKSVRIRARQAMGEQQPWKRNFAARDFPAPRVANEPQRRWIGHGDRLPPPEASEMSSYSANQEITLICADFLVERRGFELMAIAVSRLFPLDLQAPERHPVSSASMTSARGFRAAHKRSRSSATSIALATS
jgi:hypothetical protein